MGQQSLDIFFLVFYLYIYTTSILIRVSEVFKSNVYPNTELAVDELLTQKCPYLLSARDLLIDIPLHSVKF